MKTTTPSFAKFFLAGLMILALNLPSQSQITVTIGTGASSTAWVPVNGSFSYNYAQMIYPASGITAGGGTTNMLITKISFYLNTYPSTPGNVNMWNVYMGNTSTSTFASGSSWIPIGSMTQVFSGSFTYPNAGSWIEIVLTTPFAWNGNNLVVAVNEIGAGNSAGTPPAFAYSSNTSSCLYSSKTTLIDPAAPASGTVTGNRPNIQLEMISNCSPITVYPWTENFDTMSTVGLNLIPNCWLNISGTKAWASANAASSPDNMPYSSPNYMSIEYGNTLPSQLWTPAFHLTAGYSYNFSFHYNTNGTSAAYVGFSGSLLANTSQSDTGATLLSNFISPNQGTAAYTLHNIIFTPTTTANYHFGLKVSSSASPKYLGVDDFRIKDTTFQPSITSLGSSSGCEGTSLTINGSFLAGATAVAIGGSPAIVTATTATSLTVTVGSGTTGTVSVTTPGGTAVSSASFTVFPSPATPGVITSNSPQCTGTGITFTKGSCLSGTCYWQTSATGTSTTNSAATYQTAGTVGTYQVWVRAFNGSCWSSAVAASGLVNTKPTAPIVGTITQPTCTLATGSVVLWTLPTNGTWTVSRNPGGVTTTGTAANTTISGIPTGTFTFTVTDTLGCTSNSSANVVINAQPATPPTPTITLVGNSLYSSATFGNQWYNQSGSILGATSQSLVVTANGDYFVIVKLNGCSSDSSNVIHIINAGINSAENVASLQIYPNPTSNEFVMELGENLHFASYEIFNLMGEKIAEGSIQTKTIVQTRAWAKGIYVIKPTKGSEFNILKIVKE